MIIRRFGTAECKPVDIPTNPGTKLVKLTEVNDEDKKLPYRNLVGALNYLSLATRLNISYACCFLGQYNNCHNCFHWIAVKRVLKYLKSTSDVA